MALRPVERLPDDLVNKIAAGEVIERPASVVKELVENALDAEARQIRIDVESGGKSLVRVNDDGHGMSRADAELAAERHATSKLREFADLHSLATSGFRGEALPSIASVSRFVLKTREEKGTGTEVEIEHGRLVHVRDVGHPRGTTVETRDLFGEVPARRKFLRADSTETAHIAETVSLLAIAHPERGFWLKSGGRSLVEAPPVDALGPRLYQLFGGRLLDDLIGVDGGEEWARVSGLVSRPDAPRSGRPNLRLFVNGRPVRDRALAKAVSEAYRRAGAGERGFEAFLRLEVPAHLVDVNVHPAKTEVRFADPRTVWTAVERALSEALTGGVRRAPAAVVSREEGAVAAVALRYLDRAEEGAGERSRSLAYGIAADPGPTRVAEPGLFDGAGLAPDSARELRVLGQHRNTYIVASDGEELVLVDQHTAHERVRFEGLLARVERRAAESQLLLAPTVWSLAPELLPLLEEHAEALAGLGYDVEAFGGGSARVRAVPALLGPRDPGPALERLLRDVSDREGTDWAVAGFKDRLAATLACHSAVRAGQPLSVETMTSIARDLSETRHPTLCPHGRPTIVRLPKEDVSRWFGRVGWRRR